ncbi:MAG: hypothetical protein EU548_04930 [Promethearchaeota archaeon]|nr:MAG: hypothetical protein EU548_04930 [Candidatus Lokiarchaeota archaeon]
MLFNSYTKIEKVIMLRIQEAYKDDLERGIIRIDPSVQAKLDLKNGEAFKIYLARTCKNTVALLYPGKIEDKGTKIIRMSPALRRNLDAKINDQVSICKIEAPIGEKVIFAPYFPLIFPTAKVKEKQDSINPFQKNRSNILTSLQNRVVSKGYKIRLSKKPIDLGILEYKLKEEKKVILRSIKRANISNLKIDQLCFLMKRIEEKRRIRKLNQSLLRSIRKSKAQIYYDIVVYKIEPNRAAIRIGIKTKFKYEDIKQGYIGLFPRKDIKLENVLTNLKKIAHTKTIIGLDEFQRILSISDNLFNSSIYQWASNFNFKIENNQNLIYNKEDMSNFISMFQREAANINKANKALPEKFEYEDLTVSNNENKDEDFKKLMSRLRKIADVTTRIQISKLKEILGVNLLFEQYEISDALFDQKLYEWAKEYNFKFEKDYILFDKDEILNFINMLENKYRDWENSLKKKIN